MPSKADDFHKGLVKIISDNYTKSKSNGVWGVGDAQQQQRLDRLKYSIAAWEREEWPDSNHNADPFQDPYKKEILDHTAELLKAFKDYVSHSPIFPEQEKPSNRQFQSIMEIMEVPNNPQIIDQESNMNGLFYRDMVHNPNYWEATGSHIQVMRDLCDHMAKLTDISLSDNLDVEQREKASLALDTIFTSKRDSYNQCNGMHTENIMEANKELASTPEEVLYARWDDYGKTLMQDNLSQENKRPFGVGESYEVHIPPYLNYHAGVPKDIISAKDNHFLSVSGEMEDHHHSILADKVFAFPTFLAHYHQNDIDTKLKKFDKPNENPFLTPEEAANGHKYNLITQLWDSNIAPYVDPSLRESAHTSFLQNLVDGDGQVYNASIVENKVKEQCASLICEVMKVTPMSFEQLSTLNVSPEKRLKSTPENERSLAGLLIQYLAQGKKDESIIIKEAIKDGEIAQRTFAWAFYMAARYHEDTVLQAINEFSPFNQEDKILAGSLAILASDYQPEIFEKLHNLIPEDNQTEEVGYALYMAAVAENIEATFFLDTVYSDQPDKREEMLSSAILDCVLYEKEGALDHILALPEFPNISVFTDALYQSVYFKNPNVLKNVMNACPIDVKDHVWAFGLASLAEDGEETGLKIVMDAIPIADRDNLVLNGFRHCSNAGKVAALKLLDRTSTLSTSTLFGRAFCLDAKDENHPSIETLINACPPDRLNQSLAMAIHYSAADANNIPAIKVIYDKTPEKQRADVYTKALDILKLKDQGDAIAILQEAWPKEQKATLNKSAFLSSSFKASMVTPKNIVSKKERIRTRSEDSTTQKKTNQKEGPITRRNSF